ncbi:MAG: lasso peptide biosynthesis B2 protein [bacterium]
MEILKKFLYYKDVRLLWKIFITSLKISSLSSIKECQLLNILTPLKKKIKNADKDKINRYVNLYLFIRRKLGIRDTCFVRSMLLCCILRQAGIDANVKFGAGRVEGELTGHCWVSQGTDQDNEASTKYQTIFRYP